MGGIGWFVLCTGFGAGIGGFGFGRGFVCAAFCACQFALLRAMADDVSCFSAISAFNLSSYGVRGGGG